MAAKLLLYFAPEALALYRWRRNAVALERRFAPGDEALADLRQSLSGHRGALLDLVADIAGEDFQEERVPRLRGAERRAVLERRLAQRYREPRFAAALTLGAAAGERRDERVLLASFADPRALADCVEALRQAPVTIASVASTALAAPALAARLGLRRETRLLVSVNSAGLRQSLVDDGRLRFSRLEKAPGGGMSPAFVRREVERTAQFLEASRMLGGESSPLHVTLVVPEEECACFQAALAPDGRFAFEILGVGAAAKRIGLRIAPAETPADVLYLHAAALRPPSEQFLRGADRRPFLAWRLRRAMVTAGASAFAACAAYAGIVALEDRGVRSELAAAREQVARLRTEGERAQARFPTLPADAGAVKTAALEFRRIVAATAAPEAALLHLSAALDRAPEIELDALSWESTEAAGPTLEISARVQAPAQADYREIGQRIERFSKLLASGEWRIAGTRLPFDAGPQAALAGDFGVRDAGERRRFSITLARTPR